MSIDNFQGSCQQDPLGHYSLLDVSVFLVEHRNPGALGQVRENWLCHKIVII